MPFLPQIPNPNVGGSKIDKAYSDGAPVAGDNTKDTAKKEIAESIVITMPIALLVLERDLRVRIASQTFYDTFQVTPENTEGRLVYDLGNGQWNIPKLRTLLEEILPNNELFFGYEVTHDFEGIGRRIMLLNGRRLDNVELIQLVIVDITESRAAEEALQESHKRLEETLVELEETQAQLVQQERLAAVGGLAAGIAHDFNNILSIIVLNVDLGLQTPHLPPKVYKQLQAIKTQMLRGAHLVRQIRDFSRRGEFQSRPLELVPFFKELAELLQLTLPANIKINLIFGRDEYIVNADPTQMQQIIINLALNAIAAMPDGGELGMEVQRLRIVSQDEAPLPDMEVGDWIQVSVSDSGTGIAPEALPHLFEPFFTTKAPGEGSGLGLAQVYGLVQQHRAYIAVQTQEGEGTTFIIYLPAYPEQIAPSKPHLLNP